MTILGRVIPRYTLDTVRCFKQVNFKVEGDYAVIQSVVLACVKGCNLMYADFCAEVQFSSWSSWKKKEASRETPFSQLNC